MAEGGEAMAEGDKAMAEGSEAMAEGDKAMAEDAMMSSYAKIDNPDVIEVGWTLCIPSLADAQKMLSGEAGAMEAAPSP
jgi:hypothetical protein